MEVLVLAVIPAELRAALSSRHTLIERADAPDLTRFTAAVTTSIAGADAATLAALPALRLLACNGVGLDRIDLAAAARQSITVRHTPDAVRTDTADAAIALLYATVRRLAEADRFVRAGRWLAERMPPSRRVTGMRVGVVGLGAIGTMVAQRCEGLGLEVRYTGPTQKPVPWPYIPGIAALATWSDALILCCPGGDATRHLVSPEILHHLGPTGYLINVARGSVVDEQALLAALRDGTIAGAGLDVFATEPALDPAFATLENVVLMPHYAAVTQQSRAEAAATLLAAIDALAPG